MQAVVSPDPVAVLIVPAVNAGSLDAPSARAVVGIAATGGVS
jgi:hypothetical protein